LKGLGLPRQRSGVSLATGILEANGNVNAITVDNIIIFQNDQDASDPGLWAHELVHVTQYRNMGIDGFAALCAGLDLHHHGPDWVYLGK
jgi:hypothetical protein